MNDTSPNSPSENTAESALEENHPVVSFDDLGLNPRLLKALEAVGYSETTPVQAATIPIQLSKKDLLVSAETGSGKTAAFLLPMIHSFMETPAPKSSTRALILVPTRELARQVFNEAKKLCEFCTIEAGLITGGSEFKYQKALLRNNPEIIIATPGRILEHVSKNSADLSDLETLVLDEADIMLDMGLSEDVLKIIEATNPERQSLLFSATLENKHVKRVASQALSEPKRIVLSSAKDKHENILQQVILSDDDKFKERQLTWLLHNEKYEKVLIFTNTKAMAQKLCGYLRYRDFKTDTLHGDLDQDQRNFVMQRYRRGTVCILVATDVAARGLDIKGVDLVVNFDMPRSGDDYVHRIGRTGRAGEQGLAISLVAPNEWNLKASIERYLRVTMELRVIDSLKAGYKGPGKLKKSGKAAGKKKKDKDGKTISKKAAKKTDTPKERHRDKKNVGKRRSSSDSIGSKFGSTDGSASLKKND